MLTSLAVSSVGSVLFAFSSDLSSAFIARVLIAVGDALVFTALIKLVAQQFADNRFGLFSGISQVSGYIGGMMATTPLAFGVSTIGWRQCFLGIAVLTSLNLVALSLVLPHASAQFDRYKIGKLVAAILQTLKRVSSAMRWIESWGCAITFCSHFVVATSLSGVWGIPMLMNAYGFDRTQASKPMLLFMVGTIIGLVGLSMIADRTKSLLRWLIIACISRVVLLVLIAPSVGNALGRRWAEESPTR
jgi:predicted MFS family arabinose efflux permease